MTEGDGVVLTLVTVGSLVAGAWLASVAWPWLLDRIDRLRMPRLSRDAYSDHLRARSSWKVTDADGIKPPRVVSLETPRARRRKVLSLASKRGEGQRPA